MTTIATGDLNRIHEINTEEKKIHNTAKDFCIFWQLVVFLDPDLELETALKLRPYGGLIVIDHSLLNTYFKSYESVR